MRIRQNKTMLEQAADYVEAAVEKAGPILADAVEKAESALAEARDQAGPAVADAKDKAAPLIAQSAALAAEKVSQAADAAAEKAAEGKEIAAAKVTELDTESKKSHRLRNLLIITGIAALLGFAAKKLRSGDKENWQSSYMPDPPPASRASDTPIAEAAAAASAEGADEGGAGPDEVMADAAEEAHTVTTPDDPADIVDLTPEEEAAKKP
jgi:hypothetical protein